MQELTFPETSKYSTDPFDNYPKATARLAGDDVFIVMFSRTDANGKHHYMVAERWTNYWVPGSKDLLLTNAKEFKHARDRAERYFDQRSAELGS